MTHGVEVLRNGVLDQQLAARDRGQSDVRAHLDVVALDGELPAVQRLHAGDAERVRGDAFDARAQGIEEVAEVLDVRLGGGVVDLASPLRRGRRP